MLTFPVAVVTGVILPLLMIPRGALARATTTNTVGAVLGSMIAGLCCLMSSTLAGYISACGAGDFNRIDAGLAPDPEEH